MKRSMSIFLTILMLLALPMAALAETPFTLRNGYYWGMTKDEALALAQEEGLGPNTSKGKKVISFLNVPVGDFFVEMWLGLDDSLRLDSIHYNFPSVTYDQLDQLTPTFDALAQALSDVYGPCEPAIIPKFIKWKLSDTEIVLTISPDWRSDEMWQCTITYEFAVAIPNGGF